MKLLWKLSDDVTNFPVQTITLIDEISNYDSTIIVFGSTTYKYIGIYKTTGSLTLYYFNGPYGWTLIRNITSITDNTITFSQVTHDVSWESWLDGCIIPTKIYGIIL